MKPKSIGAKLTFWYAAAFASSLAILGFGMWLVVRESLHHTIDESLRDRVEGIHRFIDDHKTRLDVPEVQEEFYAHGDLFEVVGPDGSIVHRAESLHGAVAAPLGTREGRGQFTNAVHAGAPLRFFSQTVAVDGRPYTVHVAAALHDLEQGLRNALWLLAPLFPVLLLLSCAGGYWMSRRALAPVDRITQMARTIEADHLERRLEVPATGDELERLAHTLNEMMDRIEKAFKRTLRFTADASHELRTPLAVMRTTAEVALRSPRPAEHRDALEQVTAEIERTSQVVENMLLLAKADSGKATIDKRAVDLVAAVEEACAEVQVLARVKGVELDVRLPNAPLPIHGDRDALRRLYVILLDNAIKYTPPGGRVEASLAERAGAAIGAVKDTGIGIPAEDLPHVFDRFFRVDPARSRDFGGVGLGLAIGRWIAEAHGGSVTVESEVDRGSVFTVSLPRG